MANVPKSGAVGRAIVRVHGELICRDALALADRLEQLTGQRSAIAVIRLPANDLAAEQIHEQVKVEIHAAHLCGQVADVPAVNLIGPGGHQCAWLAAFLGHPLQTSMGQLADFTQRRSRFSRVRRGGAAECFTLGFELVLKQPLLPTPCMQLCLGHGVRLVQREQALGRTPRLRW
jgi:hypothetical protein